MAPYTPLARLGTFLFPSQSRRISAPPPDSPHDTKRRPAIASCDSPPRCRRRLSFDSDLHLDPTLPSLNQDLLSQFQALANAEHPVQRMPRWDHIVRLTASAPPHHRFDDSIVTPVFATTLRTVQSAAEYVSFVTALRALLDASRPLGLRDEHIVTAVMDAFVSYVHADSVVPLVSALVLRNDWGRMFAGLKVWAKVADALVAYLGAERIQIAEWDAAIRLLAECGPLVMTDESVKRVVANLDRLAEASASDLEGALKALYRILADVTIARQFVLADASAVVAEVSGVHASNLALQHACVDVLVRMASVKVLRHVP